MLDFVLIVTAVTAGIGHDTWRNGTSDLRFPTSMLATKSGIFEIHPTMTRIIPASQTSTSLDQAPRSIEVCDNPPRSQTALVTTAPSLATALSKSSKKAQCSCLIRDEGTAHYMEHIAAGFEGMVSAHVPEQRTNHSNGTNDKCAEMESCRTASVARNRVPAIASVAVIGVPGGSVVFLNTTTPDFVLIDYINNSVVIWTVPAKASGTTSETRLQKLVSSINTWLPYIEALGLLAVIWEIGKFVHARFQKRSNKQAVSSVSEVQQQAS